MVASMTNASVSEREVSCEDFASLAEPGSLIMIRAALSINDQDFGAPSSVEPDHLSLLLARERRPFVPPASCAIPRGKAICPMKGSSRS